ncbi:MAG: hypothetical protein HY909_04345 [Deltaproteobacteria bacterium]|nr:hypothetical protein [Deltaproteobacteria bacterium]
MVNSPGSLRGGAAVWVRVCYGALALVAVLCEAPEAQAQRRARLSRQDRAYLSRVALALGPTAEPVRERPLRTSSASPAEPRPTGGRRREAALESLARSGVVHRCWRQYLLRHPTAPSQALEVTVRVDASGAVTALEARSADAPELVRCVSRGVSAVGALAPGEVVEASATVTLERGA